MQRWMRTLEKQQRSLWTNYRVLGFSSRRKGSCSPTVLFSAWTRCMSQGRAVYSGHEDRRPKLLYWEGPGLPVPEPGHPPTTISGWILCLRRCLQIFPQFSDPCQQTQVPRLYPPDHGSEARLCHSPHGIIKQSGGGVPHWEQLPRSTQGKKGCLSWSGQGEYFQLGRKLWLAIP
jgi:hypothetical protein